MAVERRNPLPAGVYLVPVPGEAKVHAFDAWLERNRLTVKVLEVGKMGMSAVQPAYWYGFHVTAPTPWEGPGYPDIATPELWREYGGIPQSSFWTTVARNTASDIGDAAKSTSIGLGKAVLVAGAGYVLYRLLTRE